MASKGLPKKYAKMGFKKGWREYRKIRANPVKRKSRGVKMARRRRSYTRARKYVRRARTGGGGVKPIIDGALAGAGGLLATKYIGAYGQPIATLGVGYFRNNNTLKTLGAMQIGAILVSSFVGGAGAGNGGYIA